MREHLYAISMQALATWRKGHEFLLEDGRAHSVVVDLPPEEGGASAGTTPLELSLLALTGSLASTFVTVARKRKLAFSGLTLAFENDRPTSGVTQSGFRGILRVRAPADSAEVDTVLRTALEVCPVARVFREAGVPLRVDAIVSGTSRTPS